MSSDIHRIQDQEDFTNTLSGRISTLDKHVVKFNDSIENLEKEVRDLKNRMLEMDSAREDLRKLELQMEWINLHLLTAEESSEMEVYIDI